MRGRPAVDGRLVELEVPGMDDRPDRRVDAEAHPVGDAVVDVEELERERPERQRLRAADLVQRHLPLQPVLPQLAR